MQRLIFMVLVAALSLSVFSLTLSQESNATPRKAERQAAQAGEASPELETLYGVELAAGQISIRVLSNGCTNAASFAAEFDSTTESPVLSIHRTKADRCRRRPFITDVVLPMAASKRSFQLLNPLSSPAR